MDALKKEVVLWMHDCDRLERLRDRLRLSSDDRRLDCLVRRAESNEMESRQRLYEVVTRWYIAI
jgi:hypothetical protein